MSGHPSTGPLLGLMGQVRGQNLARESAAIAALGRSGLPLAGVLQEQDRLKTMDYQRAQDRLNQQTIQGRNQTFQSEQNVLRDDVDKTIAGDKLRAATAARNRKETIAFGENRRKERAAAKAAKVTAATTKQKADFANTQAAQRITEKKLARSDRLKRETQKQKNRDTEIEVRRTAVIATRASARLKIAREQGNAAEGRRIRGLQGRSKSVNREITALRKQMANLDNSLMPAEKLAQARATLQRKLDAALFEDSNINAEFGVTPDDFLPQRSAPAQQGAITDPGVMRAIAEQSD